MAKARGSRKPQVGDVVDFAQRNGDVSGWRNWLVSWAVMREMPEE